MVQWRSRETRNSLIRIVEENLPVVVYDLETTGFSYSKEKIIQMSAIKCKFDPNKNAFVEIDRLNEYINPEREISSVITELTGITNEMVADKPTIEELMPKVSTFFGEMPAVSGYNINSFDNKFMNFNYNANGKVFQPIASVDVLVMAKDIIPESDSENFKLATIANLYGVDKGLTFHNSMDDVIATMRLLSVLYNEYLEDIKKEEAEQLAKEAEGVDETLKTVTTVYSGNFWEGYQGYSRLYIETNLGSFYYDVRKHLWNVNAKKNPYTVEEINMEDVRAKVLKRFDVETEADLVALFSHKKHFKDVTQCKNWEKNEKHRIYISTDCGECYYDVIKGTWHCAVRDLTEREEASLKKLCYEKYHVENDDDFVAAVLKEIAEATETVENNSAE